MAKNILKLICQFKPQHDRCSKRPEKNNVEGIDLIMKVTNKMQIYRLIYCSWTALHVSGDVLAHHQEHLTVFTISGSIHPNSCRLVSWMS
jgi:hypothetical protein